MNPFAGMSLVGALTVTSFGLYVFHNKSRSRPHQLFLALSLVIGWWAFTEFGYRQADTVNTAALFMKLGLVWPLAYALSFHFAMEYTGLRYPVLRYGALPVIYTGIVILIFTDLAFGIISREIVPGTWGNWFIDIHPSPTVTARFVGITACGFGTIALLGAGLWRERNRSRIKQSQFLLGGYLLPIAANAVADYLQVQGVVLPDFSVLAVAAGCLVIGYGMWRYQLLTFSEKEAGEHLLPLLPDPLFIWRPDGIIETVNDVACQVTGYTRHDLIGTAMTRICPGCSGLIPHGNWRPGRVHRQDEELLTRGGRHIPFALASVMVGSGDQLRRIITLGRDVSVHHQQHRAQAEVQKMLEEMVASRTFLLEQALANQNFLWRSANAFASAGETDDLYPVIVDQLRGFLGSGIVAVASFMEEDKKLRLERIHGLGRHFEKVVSVIGRNPEGMAFPIPEEDILDMADAKLHVVGKGLYELAPQIPVPVCRILEKMLNISGMYSIGLVKDGKVFGNVTIIMHHGDELTEKEAVETFTSQASTALQRQHAERAIRTFSRSVMQEREEDMRELATSLHDELGSLAIGLQADLGLLEEDVKDGNTDGALKDVERVRRLMQEEINRLKRISHNLRPLNLEILGLTLAVRELAGYVTERSGLQVTCNFSEKIPQLPDRTAIVLYRIVQEALNNVVRHAGASCVNIDMEYRDGNMCLTVKDDGCGFDQRTLAANAAGRHMGLIGMRERAASLDGTLTITSNRDDGTAIAVTLQTGERNSG